MSGSAVLLPDNLRSRSGRWGLPLLVMSLAVQPPAAHAAPFGESAEDFALVKENLASCFDESVSPRPRIANCTFVIERANKQSFGESAIAKTYLARAQALQQSGDDEAAVRDFEAAASVDRKSKLPWIGLGNLYMAKANYARALENYDRALKFERPDPRNDLILYENRGSVLESLGRHDEAIADFNHALSLDPHDTIAYSNRATAYLASNRAALAIADLTTVIRDEPSNGRAFYSRGTAYERTGALDQALQDYRSAQHLLPGFSPAAAALGRLLASKDPREALADLSGAIQLDPRSPALGTRAMLYLSLGQLERAIADFNQIVANGTADGVVYMNRGVAKAKQGDFASAIEDYTRCVELTPSVPAYLNRGDAYAHLHRENEALADFDRVLEIDPRNVMAMLGRANADYTRKHLGESLDDYTHVIELDPGNANAYFKRGNIHLDLREFAAALSDYSNSLKLDPNQPVVLYNRSIADQQLRLFDEAAQDQRRARQLEMIPAAVPSADSTVTRTIAEPPTTRSAPAEIKFNAPQNVTPAAHGVVITPGSAAQPADSTEPRPAH